MSIASQITSLVTAVATAINSRSTVGPSDYQMWLAQGNTGTLQDYRTAMVGPDEDYAAYFNTNLGAYPTAGTASTTQVGVTQLATVAETQAGVIATKAITPAALAGTTASLTQAGVVQLASTAEAVAGTSTTKVITPAGYVAARTQYQYSTFATLNVGAGIATEGTILHLRAVNVTGGTHYRSLWIATGTGAIPYGPIEVTTAAALDGVVSAMGGLSYLSLSTYSTRGLVRGTRYSNDFVWNGSAWVNKNPQPFQAINDGGASTVQTFAGGFYKVTAISNTHPDWDDTNKIWTAPADGSYMLGGKIRWSDSTPASNNIGLSVLPTSSSGPSSFFGWSTPGSAGTPRFQTDTYRMWTTQKGVQFSLFTYVNGTANAQAIEFSAYKVTD